MATTSTKDKALVEASILNQKIGFNSISIQQVAEQLGIKQPSVYQHFKSKDDLGLEMIEMYRESFHTRNSSIESLDPRVQIEAYFALASKFCSQNQVCGFAALLGDYNALSKKMQKALDKMLDDQRSWLISVIEQGQKKRLFRKDKKARELAELVISAYLGVQMLGKMGADLANIDFMKGTILDSLQNKNTANKDSL